jgi:hypothetical protein
VIACAACVRRAGLTTDRVPIGSLDPQERPAAATTPFPALSFRPPLTDRRAPTVMAQRLAIEGSSALRRAILKCCAGLAPIPTSDGAGARARLLLALIDDLKSSRDECLQGRLAR